MRNKYITKKVFENNLKLSTNWRNRNSNLTNNTRLSRDWRNKLFDKIFIHNLMLIKNWRPEYFSKFGNNTVLNRSLRKNYFNTIFGRLSNNITKIFSKAKVNVFLIKLFLTVNKF